jgi:hypothetical protein
VTGHEENFDFDQRAREKQLMRDADQHDLESGRRSAQEIGEANNMFAALGPGGLRNARIVFPERKSGR